MNCAYNRNIKLERTSLRPHDTREPLSSSRAAGEERKLITVFTRSLNWNTKLPVLKKTLTGTKSADLLLRTYSVLGKSLHHTNQCLIPHTIRKTCNLYYSFPVVLCGYSMANINKYFSFSLLFKYS